MAGKRQAQRIGQGRNELLVALRMLSPAALPAGQIPRSLLVLFPELEWGSTETEHTGRRDRLRGAPAMAARASG